MVVGLITSNKGWGSLQKKDKKVEIWGGAKSIKILIYLSGFNLQRGEKFLTFPEIGAKASLR